MIVVCNASPLIVLSAAGHLDLLRGLYEQVIVPRGAYEEVVLDTEVRAGVEAVRSASWISIGDVRNAEAVQALVFTGLGRGESEPSS